MKKVFLLTILLSLTFIGKAQNFLSLDSCRALALANNKDLLISNEKISAAHYQRKAHLQIICLISRQRELT